MSLNIDQITKFTEQLCQDTKQLAAGDQKARVRLICVANKLAQALENPQETFLRLWLLDSTTKAVLRVVSDLKLSQYLPDDQSEAVGSAELAEKTGAERALLTRLLNHLVATSLIEEAGPDLFYANAHTRHFATDAVQDGFEYYSHGPEKTLNILPKYLAEHGYRDPVNGLDCPWQMALDTKLHVFEYMARDAALAKLFKNVVLAQTHVHRAHWEQQGFYPVQERLFSGWNPDTVLLVDVGGGTGLDLTNFHDSHPEPTSARLVLEDQDPVLKMTGPLPSRIEKRPHDFFQEQPIKSARAYYFHRVLHDWSDDKCREILLALRPAMVPGYSKVLIQETVIASQGATWLSTAADLVMMCGMAGRERTEKAFRDLVESAGMKVTDIYTRAPGEESIIEAIIPE